ncbi:MAG: threonine--tRNA ligase [Phycisphaerae bacterium]
MPDGKTLHVEPGTDTAGVAGMIGPRLARQAVAGRATYNGERRIIDLHQPLPGDCALEVLTASDDSPHSLEVLRHSAAHVMAEAICTLFPETKLVYGPPVDDGFYYDIDLERPITPEDFPRIEAEMARIIAEDRAFQRYELPRSEAMARLRDEGNRYKIDNADRAEGDTLSFYVTGTRRGRDFEDLCRGPHVPSTRLIKACKIRQVSRSHYRGDVNDQPLQRVYGTAFYKASSLKAFLERLEAARQRDHRVLGKALGLFTIDDAVGSGLVLWTPRGSVVRTELQNYLTAEMIKLGYDIVYTPHIGQLGLYRSSGHFPYYEDSQFPAMFERARGKALHGLVQLARRAASERGPERDRVWASVVAFARCVEATWGKIDGLDTAAPLAEVVKVLHAALAQEPGYLLKPMNCPHHIKLYASRPRSYRDLPVRLAEYGAVYRYEQSGEISGMTRVRGFTQDDAHLFCTQEQLADELAATIGLTRQVLEVLGLSEYRVRVGTRDASSDKYVGSGENWSRAESAIQAAAEASGVTYTVEAGEAAFYGPKIDFIVKDCIGRSWQLGTVQVDYNLPERFELTYIGSDNRPHVPVMVHRAPFGSLERFVGILIEHFAGAFPLWLSPVQAAVVTVSEKSDAYARDVCAALVGAGLRARLDATSEKIGPKKHRLRGEKVNYILVVGEREAASRTVNVNDRDGRNVGNMSLDAFVAACRQEIADKGRSRVAATG